VLVYPMMQQRKQEADNYKSLYAEVMFKIDEILIIRETEVITVKKGRNYLSSVL
jgi:hypothetical protein